MLDHQNLCCSFQQARKLLGSSEQSFSFEQRVLLLIRGRYFQAAESTILLSVDFSVRCQELLLLLRLAQSSIRESNILIQLLDEDPLADDSLVWYARQKIALINESYSHVVQMGLPSDSSQLNQWQLLNLFSAYLWIGDISNATSLHSRICSDFLPPERVEAEARLFVIEGHLSRALQLLSPLLETGDASPEAWELAIHIMELNGDTKHSSGLLRRARTLFPSNHRFFGREVVSCISKRQPIIARRSAILERLYAPSCRNEEDQVRSNSNLGFAYENGGRADLLRYSHASIVNKRFTIPESANFVLQLASLADPSYKPAVENAQRLLPRSSDIEKVLKNPRSKRQNIRVGFLSPDFNYHPVGRFIAMMLHTGLGLHCDLCLIATAGRDDPTTHLLRDLSLRQGSWLDVRNQGFIDKLNQVRNLDLDIAIDLAGWTANSDPGLFSSRVAPTQINYLGFFASSGIPEIDFWLGDSALFPESISEWHSESIYRLSRCFLAWQPFENLPEGVVPVPSGPICSDIVFGSFNHVRKLGDETLRLWGRILDSVPGSRLALKAYTSDDPGTTTLLRRRMARCGLDPDRVTWISTAQAVEDHLLQYGMIDVALDPFPNGGCTTTCEALWMGVPVITLAGERYVSRMSTAVLTGAELTEWIAVNEEDYLLKAIRAAEQRNHLRQSREQLRRHVQTSPLGDASALNQALIESMQVMVHGASPC